jgi:hypothetical protein
MTIYKNKEDGQLVVGYAGMNIDEYDILTREEILKIIDEADTWDAVEPEVYEALCEDLGLDYKSFDDPDRLFAAICDAAKRRE